MKKILISLIVVAGIAAAGAQIGEAGGDPRQAVNDNFSKDQRDRLTKAFFDALPNKEKAIQHISDVEQELSVKMDNKVDRESIAFLSAVSAHKITFTLFYDKKQWSMGRAIKSGVENTMYGSSEDSASENKGHRINIAFMESGAEKDKNDKITISLGNHLSEQGFQIAQQSPWVLYDKHYSPDYYYSKVGSENMVAAMVTATNYKLATIKDPAASSRISAQLDAQIAADAEKVAADAAATNNTNPNSTSK